MEMKEDTKEKIDNLTKFMTKEVKDLKDREKINNLMEFIMKMKEEIKDLKTQKKN